MRNRKWQRVNGRTDFLNRLYSNPDGTYTFVFGNNTSYGLWVWPRRYYTWRGFYLDVGRRVSVTVPSEEGGGRISYGCSRFDEIEVVRREDPEEHCLCFVEKGSGNAIWAIPDGR